MTRPDYCHAVDRACPEAGAASARFLRWATARGVPDCVLSRFAWMWVKSDDEAVGTVTLMTEEAIVRTAAQEPWWLSHGLMAIGSCLNGDPVVLDLRQNPAPVRFVSHEEMDEVSDPRVVSAVAARDLEDLLQRASDIDAFPVDYDDLRSRGGS